MDSINVECLILDAFSKRIIEEMNNFEVDILKQSKETIYNSYYKIYFYKEISNYLLSGFVSVPKMFILCCTENIINELYKFYLKINYFYIAGHDDCCYLVDEYIKYKK